MTQTYDGTSIILVLPQSSFASEPDPCLTIRHKILDGEELPNQGVIKEGVTFGSRAGCKDAKVTYCINPSADWMAHGFS